MLSLKPWNKTNGKQGVGSHHSIEKEGVDSGWERHPIGYSLSRQKVKAKELGQV